jgi:hypothetical protein
MDGVIRTDGSTHYNLGHSFRLSISRNTTKSHISLSMSIMSAEDTAIYYCARIAVAQCWDADRNSMNSDTNLPAGSSCPAGGAQHTEHSSPGAGAVGCMNFDF